MSFTSLCLTLNVFYDRSNFAAAAAAAAFLLSALVINILANAAAVVVTSRHLSRCYRDFCCSNTTPCQFGSSELVLNRISGTNNVIYAQVSPDLLPCISSSDMHRENEVLPRDAA